MRIASLSQYPIKGCGGMALEEAEVDDSGLRGDRLLFLVDEKGRGLGQVEHPRMVLIQARIIGADLSATAPGQGSLEVRVLEQGESRPTQHWLQKAPAVDQGDQASRWFSEILGTPCRLMGSSAVHERSAPEKYRHIFPAKQRRFTAVAPILLTSAASLDDLNGRIAKPIRMNRFRQNVVVAGGAPFHEEWWARLRIGEMEFEKVATSERCSVTQFDQETAERGIEPIRTLAKYRRQPGGVDGGLVFGVYFRPLAPGALRVGDEVTVLETQDRFVPNDRAAVLAEADLPIRPSDL
ncbi:MAG: MOSC domain-containing protein [Deltaproteobacteria bacterium]|nr:MOSC domain-containing protein [Deltaproteobacteria bacterium]